MKIETLYYKNNYLKEFKTKVIDCFEENGKYNVVLEETAFYPEGGGQNSDIGWIDNQKVSYVYEKNDIIYHILDNKIQVGKEVVGKIDFENRFINMQQHTAEHIVSGLICEKYNAKNVGFNMGKDFVTIDYDVYLTKAQIEEIELLANEAVYKNIDVKVNYYNKDEIKDLNYRSKKDIEGIIRIVEIQGYDRCACCGIHVSKTGEIGMIKLLSVEKYKSGCRIILICGNKAIQKFNEIYNQINKTSTLLSIKHNELFQKVNELVNKNIEQKNQISLLKNELFDLELSNIEVREKNFLIKNNLSKEEMKILCSKLLDKSNDIAGVFSQQDEFWNFQIMSKKSNLKDILKEIIDK